MSDGRSEQKEEERRQRDYHREIQSICKEALSHVPSVPDKCGGVQAENLGDLARSISLHCSGETPGFFSTPTCFVAPRNKTTLQRTSRLREAPLLSYVTGASGWTSRKLSMSTWDNKGSDQVPSKGSSRSMDEYGCGIDNEEAKFEDGRGSFESKRGKGIKRDRSGVPRVHDDASEKGDRVSGTDSEVEDGRRSESSSGSEDINPASRYDDVGSFGNSDDLVESECVTPDAFEQSTSAETDVLTWTTGDWEEQDDLFPCEIYEDIHNA